MMTMLDERKNSDEGDGDIPLPPDHIRFADGIVEDHPFLTVELDHMVALISPLRRLDGTYRGYIEITYPGDGFSAPYRGATTNVFVDRDEAVKHADTLIPLAIQKWDPMPYESEKLVNGNRYSIDAQLMTWNYLQSDPSDENS
jgi:hypothetical protein